MFISVKFHGKRLTQSYLPATTSAARSLTEIK